MVPTVALTHTVAVVAEYASVSIATINRRIPQATPVRRHVPGLQVRSRSDAERVLAPQPVPVRGAVDHPPIDDARLAQFRSLLGVDDP